MEIRKEYQALVERQLNEWKAYAEKLRKHTGELETQARREFEHQLDLIRAKEVDVREHFKRLKATGEESWAGLKVELDKAWDEMRRASDRLLEQFRKK